ncbi:MAG: hypothetical protein AB8B78_09050 [Polaribacter sp.]
MKLNFSTFFDKNYLSKGVILIESLEKYLEDFTIYVICIDKFTEEYFSENKNIYKNVITLTIADLEENDTELQNAKTNRSTIEYYFTLSPCIPLYLLKKYNLDHICTLDADIKFYSSPVEIFNYLKENSIIITPHKFSEELKTLESFGKYNVSFQIFKNDVTGLKCLNLWKKQCLNWCKDYNDAENSRYADQRYLDDWTDLYKDKVKVLNDAVSGLAPWNLNNYRITKNQKGEFLSNNKKLIFFHFHHFKFHHKNWASNGFYTYKVKYKKELKILYTGYWEDNFCIVNKLNIILNNNLREKKSFALKKLIHTEITLFLKLTKNKFVYIDVTKINPILKRIILFLYA